MSTPEPNASTAPAAPAARLSLWRRHAVEILAVAVTVVVLVSLAFSLISDRQRITDLRARADHLATQVADEQERGRSEVDEQLRTDLGVERERIRRDVSVVESLLDTAFTWDSGAAYAAAREKVATDFELEPDDVFLTEFLPPSPMTVDGEGTEYYWIDTMGINATGASTPALEVAGVQGDRYRYVVRANIGVTSDAVSRSNPDGNPISASRPLLLQVTIDADRNVFELTGVPAGGVILTSN